MFKKEKFLHQINLRNAYRQSYELPEKQNKVHCCQGTCVNEGYTICPEISWCHRMLGWNFVPFNFMLSLCESFHKQVVW